jgi:hypothetical protein
MAELLEAPDEVPSQPVWVEPIKGGRANAPGVSARWG